MSSSDPNIRPRKLAEYLGQGALKEQLGISLQAARHRQEAMDHVLFFGPPGLGKTTLSHIIAHELEAQLHETSAPALEKAGDLAAVLVSLQPNDVLFIDEIHRLSPVVEEVLYPAMEDGHLDIMVGEGPARRSVQLALPPFTLVGATTRQGALSAPLRDRFGIIHRLEFYTPQELSQIVQRSANIWRMPLSETAAHAIACSARGTPRIANRLLRRVRDVAQTKHANERISVEMTNEALGLLGINSHGLDGLDQRYLTVLIDNFAGKPVGVETLASLLAEERTTLEDVVEPYLLQQGYVLRTPRGRTITPLGYTVLGRSPPMS